MFMAIIGAISTEWPAVHALGALLAIIIAGINIVTEWPCTYMDTVG
jgi:hypothetical protein